MPADWRNFAKQVAHKKWVFKKVLKHNAKKKKKYTVGYCQRCGNTKAFNSKYGINLCRHCLREVLPQLGFKKY